MQRKTKFYVYKTEDSSLEGDVLTCQLISNIFRNFDLDCIINYNSMILDGNFYDGLCITSYHCTEDKIDNVVEYLKKLFNIPSVYVEVTERAVAKYD